jgi:hypothetical protein
MLEIHHYTCGSPTDASATKSQKRNRLFRGEHFPGHLRELFEEALDAYYGWNDGEPEPTAVLEPNYEFIGNPGAEEHNAKKKDRILTISEVFGLLWNCTDILPGSCYDQIRDNARSERGRSIGPTPPPPVTFAARLIRCGGKRPSKLLPRNTNYALPQLAAAQIDLQIKLQHLSVFGIFLVSLRQTYTLEKPLLPVSAGKKWGFSFRVKEMGLETVRKA